MLKITVYIRSHLKKRILVPDQGGADFETADIHRYFEDLKGGANAEMGPKNFFEIASTVCLSNHGFGGFVVKETKDGKMSANVAGGKAVRFLDGR